MYNRSICIAFCRKWYYYLFMTTVTAKLPPDLSAWLTKEARSRRTSKSKIIRETLEMVRNMKGSPDSVSFFDANSDLLGVFSGPRDLSTNSKHMKGYGK